MLLVYIVGATLAVARPEIKLIHLGKITEQIFNRILIRYHVQRAQATARVAPTAI